MWVGRFAVLLFLVVVPGGLSPLLETGGHDFSRIAQMAVSFVCAMALLGGAVIERGHTRWDRRVLWGIGVIAVLATASTLHAPVTAAAMRELAMVLGLAGIAAIAAQGKDRRHMASLGVAVVAAATLYSALALMSIVLAIAHGGPLERSSVILGYDNYRLFNHAQTVVLPLLVISCGRSVRGGAPSRLVWFALAMNVALLIFTLGRATALALAFAMVVSLLLFRRTAFEYLRHFSVGMALGVVVYLALFVGLPWLTASSAEALAPQGATSLQSDHSRFLLWRLALDYIGREPWLGIGPMHYAHYPNLKAAHPHNVYLQLASEWGTPLMIGLVALSAWAAWRMSRVIAACRNPEQATMGIGLFTAMIAIAIDGVFSGNFVMPVAQVWIAVAIGWAVAWTRANASAGERAGFTSVSWRWAAGLAAILLASQAWLWWAVSPELINLRAHLDHVRLDFSQTGRTAPRFWSNGWF